jgi:CBS domain-containing protein
MSMSFQSLTIKEAAPHIFQRPILCISPDASLIQAVTFLATGSQIYADGLVVVEGKRLVGRIGGYALAAHILHAREKWLKGKASRITETIAHPLQESDPVGDALEVFAKTKFAFMPVALGEQVIASLSIRDLLGAAGRIERKAGPLASRLATIEDNDASVIDALKFMVERGVRNLVFVKHGDPYVINDRKVLEYLFEPKTREAISTGGFDVLAKVRLQSLGMVKGRPVGPEASLRDAAHLLSGVETPCLFAGEKILTPWDLVMKGSGFIEQA